MTHTVTGTTGYPGFPMRFSAFGPHLYASPPPLLGQHNAEVLAEPRAHAPRRSPTSATGGVIGDRPAWESA